MTRNWVREWEREELLGASMLAFAVALAAAMIAVAVKFAR